MKWQARSADLPDALVRLAPDRRQVLEQGLLQGPARGLRRQPGAAGLMRRVHGLAIDVELELAVRGIADPHRGGALVAR